MTITQKLNAMFNKRYGQQIADLNVNVYKTVIQEDGTYEVPTVKLASGGGTIVSGKEEPVKLEPPALVTLETKKMKPFIIVYRVAVPFSEVEIAINKPEYFNYLFDAILAKAVGNYAMTVGGADKVRFGSQYISVDRNNVAGEVFDVNDDFVEFRFVGNWASDDEAV